MLLVDVSSSHIDSCTGQRKLDVYAIIFFTECHSSPHGDIGTK